MHHSKSICQYSPYSAHRSFKERTESTVKAVSDHLYCAVLCFVAFKVILNQFYMFVTTLRCKLSSNFRIFIYNCLITNLAASDMSDQSFAYFKLQLDSWNAFTVSEELLNNFSLYSSRLIPSHRETGVWLPTSVELFGTHKQLILNFVY